MNIWDTYIKEIDTEIDKRKPGLFEETPVSPKEFFTYWLPSELSEAQLDVFNNLFKGKEWNNDYLEYLLFWGEGCISADTILKDEETGKEYTVKELAEKKKRIIVKSMKKTERGDYKFINKKTGIPYKKGRAKLYKVKTKSGKEITVSDKHKFYTKKGWGTLKNIDFKDTIAVNDNNKLVFDIIKNIECIGEQDYYDLEVPDTHNYIAHDIIHHNSGKDFSCVRILIYTAYWLMCLKNPQRYFNFADNEDIDLINVSVTARHAKDVLFKRLTDALSRVINPNTGRNWFEEKGMDLRNKKDIQTTKVTFKKNITAHSLNSQKYSGEGKNILLAIFDEVAEFKPNKAKELYENLWFTAESRWGTAESSPFRIMLISYLRHEFDYMAYRWEQSKDEKNVYRSNKATWEVRPDKKKEDFDKAFKKNPEEAARRYANELPTSSSNRFFRSKEKIRENINTNRTKPYMNNIINIHDLNTLTFKKWFKPYTVEELEKLKSLDSKTEEQQKRVELLESRHSDTIYYIHLDLAKGKEGGDCAGFAMGHPYLVNPENEEEGSGVYIDLMMQLKGKGGEIDFEAIRNFIYKLQSNGFPIGFVSSDQYQSLEMNQQLAKRGIKTGVFSVDRDDTGYQTLKELLYSDRLDYYNYSVFIRELEELIRDGKKVNHPEISRRRSIEENDERGSKDVSDSVAGLTAKAIENIEEDSGDWLGVSF